MSEPPRQPPRLRKDLRILEAPQGRFAAAIENPAANIRVRLDGRSREIALLLDGTRGPNEIHLELARSGLIIPVDLIEKTIEFLARHRLLEESEIRPAVAAPGLEPPLREGLFTLRAERQEIPTRVFFLPEARHGCVACGRCCGGYTLGPVEREAVERIRKAEFTGPAAKLNVRPKVIESERQGIRLFEIEKEGGCCIFLEEGGTCLLHREGGPAFKPAGCRLYPLQFALLPGADMIGFLRMECFGYHRARRAEISLAERVEDIRSALLLLPDIRPIPERVKVGPDQEIGLSEYLELETRILDRIATSGEPIEVLLGSIGRAVAHVARGGRADRWRFGDGGSPPRQDRFPPALGILMESLVDRADQLKRGEDGDAFTRGMLDSFSTMASALRGRGEMRDRGHAASPEEDPESREILREALRNDVFSKEWLREDLTRGFSHFLVRNLLIAAGARIIASRRDGTPASPAATAEAIATVNRAIRILCPTRWPPGDEFLADEIFGSLVG